MSKSISLRAVSHNVIIKFHHTPYAHLLYHHYHCKLSPRPFTTTSTLQNPTQTPPRNIDIYLPKQPTLSSILQSSTNAPILKPITAHHDLTSYLNQQHHRVLTAPTPEARQKLTTSTTYLGTRYEYLIQSHLQRHLGFTLTRIGGKGDGGVDLIGSWTLPVPVASSPVSVSSSPSPSSPQPKDKDEDKAIATPSNQTPTFRILLQAKRIAPHRSPIPSLMRELDGTILSSSTSRWISAAFALHSVRTEALSPDTSGSTQTPLLDTTSDSTPTEHSPEIESKPSLSDLSHLPTLGILVTTRPLTSGIEKAMASSRRCLIYVCLEEVEVPDEMVDGSFDALGVPATKVRQIAWNSAASRAGLEGYNVVTKYSDNDDREARLDGEAVMMFQGQPVRSP